MTTRLLLIPVITKWFIADSSTEMSGLESEEASEDESPTHDEDWTPDESILSGAGDREQRGEITNNNCRYRSGTLLVKWISLIRFNLRQSGEVR